MSLRSRLPNACKLAVSLHLAALRRRRREPRSAERARACVHACVRQRAGAAPSPAQCNETKSLERVRGHATGNHVLASAPRTPVRQPRTLGRAPPRRGRICIKVAYALVLHKAIAISVPKLEPARERGAKSSKRRDTSPLRVSRVARFAPLRMIPIRQLTVPRSVASRSYAGASRNERSSAMQTGSTTRLSP